MKKELGPRPYLYPMPVLMIATYDEDGIVDVMNMAWGGICGNNAVALNINADHKTAKNIQAKKAFTLSVADVAHLEEADYLGMVSGNTVADKFERSGLHATKSARVDAPVVDEFPLTLECRVADIQQGDGGLRIIGEIINVLADESTLDDEGEVDPTKLNALVFDTFKHGYYAIGEKVGQAWSSGGTFIA